MKTKASSLWVVLLLLAAGTVLAQNPAPSPTAGGDGDGRQIGGYQVQQSVELGYRFADVTGSSPMYDTFIDQAQGLRLMQQSLSMRAPSGTGMLFDDLSISSFGWGGEPENVARAKVSKFKYYDLNFLFRRDHNYFDYDLLANPLNPPTSSPAIAVDFSPHSMYNTRRMYDFDLTLLPQSKFSIRLGMTHNRSDGPTFSTIHEGTEALLYQGWNVTDNLFRFGFDLKVLPKTTISYDQYIDFGKNDTDYSLEPFATYLLPGGTPVDLGISWNTAGSAPCAAPLKGGAANPTCNGQFSYLRNQRVRSTAPTEQLRMVSNYLRRVSLVAQTTYSNTDLSSPYLEIFNGLISRNGEREDYLTGPANTRRIDATADLGLTITLTKALAVSDSFRYDHWHMPATWDSVETVTAGVAPVTLLSPLGTATTTSDLVATFLGMRSFYNVLQVQYNPSRRVGVRAGYKVQYRNVFKADPETIDPVAGFAPFEGDSITSNQQGPVFGLWLRPTNKLRIDADVEALTTLGCQACPNAEEIFITRISPRQQQNYRGRLSYKPVRWADVSSSVTWWEARNGEADTQAAQHNRNAGVTLSLFPNDRISVDMSYNFSDILQDAYICYNGSYLPAGAVANGCPTFSAAANNNPNWIYSTYANNTHYFNGVVLFKPVKKLRANVGYGLIKTDGNTTILNTLEPLGPLQFTYHQPLASLSYEAVKDWSLNAYWNYDQYAEGSFVGPTLPRYFHDNRTVLSVKYAF